MMSASLCSLRQMKKWYKWCTNDVSESFQSYPYIRKACVSDDYIIKTCQMHSRIAKIVTSIQTISSSNLCLSALFSDTIAFMQRPTNLYCGSRQPGNLSSQKKPVQELSCWINMANAKHWCYGCIAILVI